MLEIGGELQHGALVAREFGKPCVAGIADVMSRIEDGQTVEVDGGAGTVRIIPELEGSDLLDPDYDHKTSRLPP